MASKDELKRAAAERAVSRVESGMRLGLGTGSTMAHFLDLLGSRLEDGSLTDVEGVPTSLRTGEHARRVGIPVGDLHELAPLDLAVDGADEIDPDLNLVKGLGGALLREKMVAAAARRFVVIADEGKLVDRLGERSPLPVEVVPFAWRVHLPFLEELGAHPTLREGDEKGPYRTDNGNFILDCHFDEGWIPYPHELAEKARSRPGIVETGLFMAMASEAFVAGEDGVLRLVPGEGS